MSCLKTFAFASTLLFTLSLPAFAQRVENAKDSLKTVQEKVKAKKAVLVDVRTRKEWDRGHLKGAILFPLIDLEAGMTPKQIAEKLPKDKILYTHCVVGARALAVQEMLKPLGYDVRALKPGYKELVRYGFPKAEK